MTRVAVTRKRYQDGQLVRTFGWSGVLGRSCATGCIVVDGSYVHVGRWEWADGRTVDETSYQVEEEK